MAIKKIISIFLGFFVVSSIVYLIVNETGIIKKQKAVSAKQEIQDQTINNKQTKSISGKIINGLYFHGKNRCYTCNLMESYIRDVLVKSFSKELEKGLITFESINVEDPDNIHNIQKYQLRSISFFLSLKKDGEEVSFINLDKIWQLVRQETEFKKYIEAEIKKFLEI